ncbi:MAG: hypothetical protein AAFU73_19400 [Planctomycetota bacterium]
MERPTTSRAHALLLAAGALLGALGMALHPTDGLGAHLDLEAGRRHAAIGAFVHAVVIVSLALQFTGSLAVARRLGRAPARADLGLVSLALGTLAATAAATTNGLAAPVVLELVRGGNGDAVKSAWELAHHVAGVATQLFLVGASLSAALWGSALARRHRALGALGLSLGVGGLVATSTGAVRPEIGPLLAFVLAWELWTAALALWLWRTDEGTAAR